MEIKFIANIIEQLDFALDHLALPDANYKRLALMLIDNAMELALHQYAQQEAQYRRSSDDQDAKLQKALAAALGQQFDAKVKFAVMGGLLTDEEAFTINTLHTYRNQVYHRGLMHEDILHSLSIFYFLAACDVLAKYPAVGYAWSSRLKMPHRAIKYISLPPFRDVSEKVAHAWIRLKEVASAIPFNLVHDLHTAAAALVDETDRLIEYLSNGLPESPSRDKIVIDAQAWSIAFTEEGNEYARKHGANDKTVGSYVEWIASNYPLDFKRDPIASWRKRLESLRAESNPHAALKKYHELIRQSENLREEIDQTAAAFDQEIERQMDAARGM
jgi:hypothetical protein